MTREFRMTMRERMVWGNDRFEGKNGFRRERNNLFWKRNSFGWERHHIFLRFGSDMVKVRSSVDEALYSPVNYNMIYFDYHQYGFDYG